mgnify:CR=1 FL=1
MMDPLPYDHELVEPEAVYELMHECGIEAEIIERDEYPRRPIFLSDYQLDPPRIHVYRYQPLDDWLNWASQQQVGFYGPWYYLHITYRFYFHLEMTGLYEVERNWKDRLLGRLATLEDRAYAFTQVLLGTRYSPERFDRFVEKSFRPGL